MAIYIHLNWCVYAWHKIYLNKRGDGLGEFQSIVRGLTIRDSPCNQFGAALMIGWQEVGAIPGFECCLFLTSETMNRVSVSDETSVHPGNRGYSAVIDENVHLKGFFFYDCHHPVLILKTCSQAHQIQTFRPYLRIENSTLACFKCN